MVVVVVVEAAAGLYFFGSLRRRYRTRAVVHMRLLVIGQMGENGLQSADAFQESTTRFCVCLDIRINGLIKVRQ